MKQYAFVIAGVSSGAGKTTVTLGLMAALRKKGLQVQPFKAGPDYIDPGHHTTLCGRPSYNLDPWMMGEKSARDTFDQAMDGADVGIVEGVMGLFDGRGGGFEGSSAHLTEVLGLPVILVLDAARMAGSAAAIVSGFENFHRAVRVAGVIFNRVGSDRHFSMLKEAVETHCGAKVLGCLPREEEIAIPERHLGLVVSGEMESGLADDRAAKLSRLISDHISLDAILALSPLKDKGYAKEKPARREIVCRIAVAYDEAFCFYYRQNLNMLEAMGAELAYFSPVKDKSLPCGSGGIYLGGGYPELYGKTLHLNESLKNEIKSFSESGRPVYAECGGLMYLGQGLKSLDGESFEMVGVFPWHSTMLKRRKSLGYREVTAGGSCPFLEKGQKIRGHEFHYSEIRHDEDVPKVYSAIDSNGERIQEGYLYKNTLASYVHLHFASNPNFADGFVKLCHSLPS